MASNKIDTINKLLEEAYNSRSKDISNSIVLGLEALELSEALNDKALIGKSLNRLALFYMIMSEFDKSNAFSERAIKVFESIKDNSGIADAKYNIGSVLYKSDDYHGGLANLLESLKIYRENGDLANQSKVEKAVGTIYGYIGDEDNAFKTYISAIRTARKLADKNLESNVLNNLSGLFIKNNKPKMAMATINQSIRLKRETEDLRGLGFSIYGRGKVYLETGDYNKGEKDFLEAFRIHIDTKEQLGSSMALSKLGKLYYKIGDFEKAEQVIKQSLNISFNVNATMVKLKNYHLLYLLYKTIGNSNESLKYLELYFADKEAVMKTQTLKVIENYELINRMNNLENEARIQKEKQRAIDKKNEDDKEAVRLKQEFLSIMSHEIRTPLNAITTSVSLLKDKMKEADMELFDSLQFASNNLINIVNDVLDFTKLDSNKSNIEERNINFEKLCSNIVNLHRNDANSKGLQLIFDNKVPSKNFYYIDQPKIAQILGNLISNAIKFTSNGEIRLTTEIVNTNKLFDNLRFSVADTGEGISQENLKVVFDSFSQIQPVTTREQGGTGLGLAIVKKLVSLYKGEISVHSELNKGSEFYFTIKLKKATKAVSKVHLDFSILKGNNALIAEDNMVNALLMKKVLSKWDITSEHVKDGKAAFEASKNKTYDFILMDIHMPNMNGIESTKLIRTKVNKNKNTPVFAVTADVLTKEDKENEALFDAILWKPLEIEKLFLALSKYNKAEMLS
ncbi:tetratricopeptide repeat-containing hybrid sensor histidine kinase/response regulator [Winogradskyella flava]|uniref:tetratricopeptide repeat-containing hybrid sensor histidine kinase/response regulator n=1 Tax=Winogradskyella flava TaxID=1884876 RepID=UPI0024934E5A|nr:ATP-binding protein [Winogradskyella flava]